MPHDSCDQCNKPIRRTRYEGENGTYCSDSCRTAAGDKPKGT